MFCKLVEIINMVLGKVIKRKRKKKKKNLLEKISTNDYGIDKEMILEFLLRCTSKCGCREVHDTGRK